MAKCPGVHCPGCGERGGGVAVVVVVLAVIAVLIRKPVERAADTAMRVIGDVLHILLIAAECIGAAAAAFAVGYAGLSVYRWRASRAVHPVRQLEPLKAAVTLSAPQRPAIEATRPPSLYVITNEHRAEEKS
ncbi:MAG: hypothetical protein ACLP52_31870 [Streptosporangiaceae bacterium]